MPDGGEERRSYEKVNGPVPRVELFDETGLAQQTSGPSLPPGMPNQIEGSAAMNQIEGSAALAAMADFEPVAMSNIDPASLTPEFAQAAAQGAADRLAQGFAADGSLGGPFSEHHPPEGKEFGGFLKGNTGIVWKTKT